MDSIASRLAVSNRAAVYWLIAGVLFAAYFAVRGSSWDGSELLHTIMETGASLLAFLVGVLAIVRFYAHKNNTFLFIGVGFIGTAFLDGYHAIVTSTFFEYRFPSTLLSLLPWSWVASRVYLSVLLWLSWLTWTRENRLGDQGKIREIDVYGIAGLLTIGSFVVFALLPLPRAYYPELFFHRPEEFVPAAFFLMALVGYVRKGAWRRDSFEHWLVISLVISFMSQAAFMSFSGQLFDAEFDAAHLLKIVSYLAVLIGLLINIYHLFRTSEIQNQRLLSTIERLRAAESSLALSEREQRQVANESAVLAELGRLINSSLNINQTYEQFAEQVKRLIPFDRMAISLVDIERNEAVIAYLSGAEVLGRNVGDVILPFLKTVGGEAVRKGRPIVVDADSDEYLTSKYLEPYREAGMRSILAVALGANDDPIGVLILRSVKENAYGEREIRLVERLGAQIAGAIANGKLYDERVRAEKALSDALEELKTSQEHLVQSEKMRALGTMVAGVAHELNNPMMGILNYSQYCVKRTSEDDRRYQVLKDIEKETQRCVGIVQNLLTFSRMQHTDETTFIPSSCPDLIERVLRMLSFRIENEGVSVRCDVTEGTPDVPMSVTTIQQVFLNIIINALDALKESDKRTKEIEISIIHDEEFVEVGISDNAGGISPQAIDRIFDPFFTTKSVGQGTGLGLSISYGIIKDHNGDIICESKQGAGTTFKILLPKFRRSENDISEFR